MADLKEMTVKALRDLARKHVGPGYSKLKTKSELLAALTRALPRSLGRALRSNAPEAEVKSTAPEAAEPAAPSHRAPAAEAVEPAPTHEPSVAGAEPDPDGFLVTRVAGEAA